MLALVPVALRRHMSRLRLASFYQRAIEANRHTARAVATTPYLQRMHDGALSPLDYGCLTVQDAYYCYRAKETLAVLLGRVDAAEQPDRDEAIDRILEEKERFELLRIQNLIRKLRSRGINIFGGPIGSQDLFEDDFEGFYLLSDGKILYCRDRSVWDEDMMDGLVDGVVSYYILDPQKFSIGASKEQCYGSLRGDRFSDLAETLYKEHGRVVSVLAKHGTELFTDMRKALGGDSHSAAVASHHLRINLCVVN